GSHICVTARVFTSRVLASSILEPTLARLRAEQAIYRVNSFQFTRSARLILAYPTHGRRQPAAAPTQVCVCMGPLSLISGRGSERPGDVKSARSGRGAANP